MLEKFDKDYLKQVVFRVAAFIGGILIAAYIGYQIWHSVTSFVETEPALPFTVTEKSSGDGYIFREEKIIPAPENGSLVSSVSAGEKVPIKSEVAKIYTVSGAEYEARLSEIDRQISLLTASLGDGKLTNRDVSKLDSEVYEVLAKMKISIALGNYSEATAQRTSLITKINKRNVASGETSDIPGRITALQNERNSLTQKLGLLKATVYAPSAGWYFPETDGYENIFTPSEISGMTYDSFKNLVSSASPESFQDAGKMVTDCKWFFVCEVSADSLKNKKEGEKYTVFFTNNQSAKIDMTLEKICESENGKIAAAVYSSEKIPSSFDFARMQNYEILENEYNGYRVPKDAVRILDGQTGVFVLTGEVVHFRKIEVLTEYEGSYIVAMKSNKTADEENDESSEASEAKTEPAETDENESFTDYMWLGLNENIITSGKGLREGRIITNID